ncbi:hypothetical protein [Candidatus Uabimicrobium amorphum]|uniref:Uncharacterized protein n=1 Tax=Uabimicrobium amorphum TaxID=2596890 RepID=A0A5S9IR99_UABAM|nr:hypothetical protein [Candidatus Uabimicrobium amorphum]BBM85225.1 hypothetical protein UABAM_03588 [Candidatus Uabimicrobium amorphum]
MRNLLIVSLSLFFIGQVMAKDFSRSDKKKIDKAFVGAKLAEEGKTGADFKKGYKTVKSALKSLKRKYADHPQVLELEKRFVELEKLVPHENARADLEKSLKKMKNNLKKVAGGVASAKKKLQKDTTAVQTSMVHLKMTKNARFANNISVAEKALAEAKEHGVELRSEEQVIEEIKLEQSMLNLTRSQLSAIKKIEKAIAKAEKKDEFAQIKKEMDNARKLLEPLSEALADNLKVKSLQERCDNLEDKLASSKVAFDLRGDLKKLDANLKSAEKAKDFDKIDRAVSSAKSILAKIGQKDLTDNEEIEKQIDAYKERVEGLEDKYNSLKLVSETKDDMKKLSYKIPFAEKSFDYRKVKSSMEEAKPVLTKLNNKDNLQDNEEIAAAVKDYTQRFAKLEEKIVFCKKQYDLSEEVEQLDRDMRDLFRAVERALEQKQLPITASSDKYQIMGNAKAFKEAIVLTPQHRKKYSEQMAHVKKEMEILQKRNGEAFSRTIGESRELVDAWQHAMDSEKPLFDHGMMQAKQLEAEQQKGMQALYTKIGSFKVYPKEHLKELETFLTETSTNVWSYMSPFNEHKDFSALVKKSNTCHENGKKYFELIRATKYIHSSLGSGDLGIAKYRFKEVRNTQHEESKKIIAFYDNYLKRWEAAKKDLNKIYSTMLGRLAKSSGSLNSGFEKFRGKFTIIPANRLLIIKDLNANAGKAIKDMTRESLSYSTAWKLNHGNDLFYYALDPALAQRAAVFYQQLKEKFNGYRLQVAKKHTVEERGLPYWRSPGYLHMDMVAVVDTTVNHTPRIAIKDQTGTIKGYVDGTTIQIVKVRVVGYRSKYFTMWQNSPQQQADVSGLYR